MPLVTVPDRNTRQPAPQSSETRIHEHRSPNAESASRCTNRGRRGPGAFLLVGQTLRVREPAIVRKVLLTGSAGLVGTRTREVLESAGIEVRPFDLVDGHDLRDEQAVREAARGCDAVVHAGAIAHDSAGSPAAIMATNVLGTWHVLLAAEAGPLTRVVYLSSGQVFGFAEGERTPDSLPIDDSFPLLAARPYGLSKRLAEEMCEAWTGRTGIPTVVLRPVMILWDGLLEEMSRDQTELDSFVHVDDVADAVHRALTVELVGCHRLTLCGPGVFDTSRARQVLEWRPSRGWTAEG